MLYSFHHKLIPNTVVVVAAVLLRQLANANLSCFPNRYFAAAVLLFVCVCIVRLFDFIRILVKTHRHTQTRTHTDTQEHCYA